MIPEPLKGLGQKAIRVMRWFRVSPAFLLLGLALVVGVITGFVAVLFRSFIGWVAEFWFMSLPEWFTIPYWVLFCVAPMVGLAVAAGIARYCAEARGSGVPEVMASVALHGGRMRFLSVPAKFLASGLCIGSGGSVGREGPIVQIGSAIGSFFGQMFHFSGRRVSNLVACGSAAGIAATFNAPIAGVFFALEIVLGEVSVGSAGAIVIAAVVGGEIGRSFFGDFPAFLLPTYEVQSLAEFSAYFVLGIFCGVVGPFFARSIYRTEKLFENFGPSFLISRGALGGLLLGLLGIGVSACTPEGEGGVLPPIFGVGYEAIEYALQPGYLLLFAIFLVFTKILATSITLGAGGSGGVFAPTLLLGALVGSVFGEGVELWAPFSAAPAGAYALVGMAGVFAAASGAIVTPIIMLFELTGNYQIILPLMTTVAVSGAIGTSLLRGQSIYTLKLFRRGVSLAHGRLLSVMEGVSVAQALQPIVAVVGAQTLVSEMEEEFARERHQRYPVIGTKGELLGIVDAQSFQRKVQAGAFAEHETLQEIDLEEPVFVSREDSLRHASELMTLHGRQELFVVDSLTSQLLVGVIKEEDLFRTYKVSLYREREGQTEQKPFVQDSRRQALFVELRVFPSLPFCGSRVAEIARFFPKDSLLTGIEREGELIIPHGETKFLPGDELRFIVQERYLAKLLSAFFLGQELGEEAEP